MDDSDPEEETHDADVDLVNAFSIHTEQGFKALRILVDKRLDKASGEKRRQVAERLLDLLHRHTADYRDMALQVIAEEEFPESADRWPLFFTSADAATVTGRERNGPVE